MEEVALYECVYNRSSKDFKAHKNKKASCWDPGKRRPNFST